jgi:hypothetical protein
MMVIKSIGVLALGKMNAVLGAIFGLIYGTLLFLYCLLAAAATGHWGIMGMGFAFLILGPVGSALCGFIGGVIYAFIYNVVASIAGGIEIELVRAPIAQVQNPYQKQ